MRRQRAFALVFAVCCLFVLTSLSASLESTVSGTPDEVIDPDFESLPLSVEEASEIKDTYESGPGGEGDETAESSQSNPQSQSESQSGGESDSDASSSNSDESESESSESAGGGPSENEGDTAPDPDPGLWTMLYGLLQTLLAALRAALPALVLLAAALLAVHQRDRLLAWLESRLGGDRPAEEEAAGATGPTFRPPANRVEQAWAELLSAADVDLDPSATPRECAELLARDGFDGDAVRELARTFEEVRYAEAPVTPDREQRALRCLRRSEPDAAGPAPGEVTE